MVGLTGSSAGRTSAYPAVYSYVLWSTILCVPMFATGLSGFDIFPHRRLALHFDALLHQGIWYPRWLPDVNHGYGNPTFIFYNPVYYYVVSACHLILPGIDGAMYLAALLGLLLSGLAMYGFAREILCARAAAWAGLAYILLPYHAMNLYSRSALAEFWAMAWMPLILQQVLRLRRGYRAALAGLAATYAGLIYTHLCSAFLFSLLLYGYILYLCWSERGLQLRYLVPQVGGVALGLALGAAYLLPALLEQQFVHIRLVRLLPWGNPLDNFLFFRPSYGMGFSLEVSIGAVLTLISLVASYQVLRRVSVAGESECTAMFFIASGLVSLFLMTCLSWPLWRYLPVLPSVQFPWRLLTVTTLCAAIAIGSAYDRVATGAISWDASDWTGLKHLSLSLVLVPSFLWLGFVWWEFIPPRPPPDRATLADIHRNMSAEEMTRLLPVIFADRSWDILEFRPVWAPLALPSIAPPVTWTEGNGIARVEQWSPLQRRISLVTRRPGRIKLRTFYYPGWSALLDGHPAAIWPDPVDGSITLYVPAGPHQLEVVFGDIPVRARGRAISQAALVILLAVWLAGLLATRKPP